MTGTRMEEQFVVGCYSFLPNMTLAEMLLNCLKQVGAPGHSWFYTAACGTGLGHRGARAAAKVLALAGYRRLTDPPLVRAAQDEHVKNLQGKQYQCPI